MVVANPNPSTSQFDYTQSNLITRAGYDSNNNLAYTGWAVPGTLTSEPGWRIMQSNYQLINSSYYFSYSAFPCDVNGNPSCGFAFVWDNRASLTYA